MLHPAYWPQEGAMVNRLAYTVFTYAFLFGVLFILHKLGD